MTKHNTTSQSIILAEVIDAIAGKQDGTFGPELIDEPKFDGFWVGGFQPSVTLTNGDDLLDESGKLSEVAALVKSSLDNGGNVGVWTNPEDGVVWVDESRWFADQAEAVEQAQANRELAIWDVKGEREVNVGTFLDGEYVKLI